jgi:hypothetical protein
MVAATKMLAHEFGALVLVFPLTQPELFARVSIVLALLRQVE